MAVWEEGEGEGGCGAGRAGDGRLSGGARQPVNTHERRSLVVADTLRHTYLPLRFVIFSFVFDRNLVHFSIGLTRCFYCFDGLIDFF